MGIVEQNCMKLLRKCMEKKMSADTIAQVAGIINYPKVKALKMIKALMQIVESSTERQLREKLSELIVMKI